MAKKKGKNPSTPRPAPLTRWDVLRPGFNRALFVLALLGTLVVFHLALQQKRGFDQGCWGFNPPAQDPASAQVFDCQAVTESGAGSLLGVSNIVWGMGFYLLVAGLSYAIGVVGPPRRRTLKQARAALITGGFLYAMYLVYYQVGVLDSLCALCLTSAGITTALFLTQAIALFTSPASSDRMTKPSFGKPAFYAGLAGLVLLLAGADFLYFQNKEVEAPPAVAQQPPTAPELLAAASPDECAYSPEGPTVEDYEALITFRDPLLGNPDAEVTLVEFFDPNCPHCRTGHTILTSVIERYGDQAKVAFVPFTLWTDPQHPNYSLQQTEALYAAAQQGKYYELLEAMFARQNGAMPLDVIQEIAEDVGMDVGKMTQQIQSRTFLRPIMQRRREIADLGVRSTPTLLLNGRKVDSHSAACIGTLIEQEAGTAVEEG